MPFNIFGPFVENNELAKLMYEKIFSIKIQSVSSTKIEFAPEPKSKYLNDGTSFDAYIEYINYDDEKCGIGVEVKYTELEYSIGVREKENIENKKSKYWEITENSKIFKNENIELLGSDMLRQIWRNHLLGLSMIENGDINKFNSVTIHPSGNSHFFHAIKKYQELIHEEFRSNASNYLLEDLISKIDGNEEIIEWKKYLFERYIVLESSNQNGQ
jgi:hypothetical protein